ncbi:MAG: HD domain-containing protein [Patescibacteria group bacterium]|nr:HD domain-containing protein [Patescibacteria group bacterium]
MKGSLKFLIEANKLKKMSRTGWVSMHVKNSESIACHIFRVAVASWLMAEKANLDVKRAIKIALFHDLCEVYAGDSTPFDYYHGLSIKKKKDKKLLMRWVRLSKKEKQKKAKEKFNREKKALLKLISPLEPKLKDNIYSHWYDYEKRISKEAKFVKQLDRIETLLQSIEYFGSDDNIGGTSWWEGTEEIVEDPLLLDFLTVIKKRLYRRYRRFFGERIKVSKTFKKREKELTYILDFLLEIGKLKHMPRLYWTIRDVKNPETVAGHMFTLALMTWLFSSQKSRTHDAEKMLKMALIHEISAVYTGDSTPYDRILKRKKGKEKEVLKKWPRLSKKEKMKKFIEDFKQERRAFKRLGLRLKGSSGKEIYNLWHEYRTKNSPEGRFLSQLNVMAVLLQALDYEKKDKNFAAAPIWEWALEVSDNDINFKLMDEMKKTFYK